MIMLTQNYDHRNDNSDHLDIHNDSFSNISSHPRESQGHPKALMMTILTFHTPIQTSLTTTHSKDYPNIILIPIIISII